MHSLQSDQAAHRWRQKDIEQRRESKEKAAKLLDEQPLRTQETEVDGVTIDHFKDGSTAQYKGAKVQIVSLVDTKTAVLYSSAGGTVVVDAQADTKVTFYQNGSTVIENQKRSYIARYRIRTKTSPTLIPLY